jgi:GT2 family glycosyltransferase
MVRKKYPKTKLIESKENIGFGRGNNLGMKVAKGRYVLLLNSDTRIDDANIFSEMVDWMDNHKDVGISSCSLLNKDGSYQGSGGYFPTLPRIFAWMSFMDDIPFFDKLIKPYHPMHPWSFFKNESYFKKMHKQDWVTAAYFLIRKKVIDEIGYFDKDFFAYVEEVEYCYRTKKKGWEVVYLPQWKITHYGQVSSNSEFAMLSEFKGLKIFYEKHMAKWKMPVLRFLLKAGSLLRMIILGTVKGEETRKIYAKAIKEI